MPTHAELERADALVLRILKARAEAIERKLMDDPDAALTAVDLSVLKELRKVSMDVATRHEQDQASALPDPAATELGEALLDGDLKKCFRLVGEAVQRGRSHPSVCGQSVLRVITSAKSLDDP